MDRAQSWPHLPKPSSANPPSADSWIEISSQPSSSSLSSVNDEIITTGLRVQAGAGNRRRRRLRAGGPSHLNITSRAPSVGVTSSQEEYEESESESDQVMTSSNEGLSLPKDRIRDVVSPALQSTASDDDDEDDRTAINYPINNECYFAPQPNAFTHAAGQQGAVRSQPVPGSYLSSNTERPAPRPSARHSYPSRQIQHSPYNVLSPSHNAAADHDAALRASLNTIISFAGAARGLQKKPQEAEPSPHPVSNRVDPTMLRMVPESALREASAATAGSTQARRQTLEEPSFKPTIRRASTSTSASADPKPVTGLKAEGKRKVGVSSGRGSSKDRSVTKKRRSSSAYGYGDGTDLFVSPTLLTWVVVAGVGVFISALSFSAGYSMGKEVGRLEVSVSEAGEAGACAREVSRTGLGLRKLKLGSVARSVGVGA